MAEIQERRNALTRRIKLWRTAQAVYMPQILVDQQDPPTSIDAEELKESKPEIWSLSLPSQLPQDNWSSFHKGIVETEQALRLAQVQDSLVDLRRLRRTLRSLRTYFRSNVVGEGQKTQTKSRTIESGVVVRINRAVRRYRLARSALVSLDPMGDWRKEYRELTDKDNRGPGKEQDERGIGDGRYMMSWIWGSSFASEDQASELEVNETVRHEWMTCRARADRWKEESDLLQEEMRRVITSLEWKSSLWGKRVGSRSGSLPPDIQHGVDSYARKQASVYHELAVSLANQWLPRLHELGLDVTWARTYSWTAVILPPVTGHSTSDSGVNTGDPSSGINTGGPSSGVNTGGPSSGVNTDVPSSAEMSPPSGGRNGFGEPVDSDNGSEDESEDEECLDIDGEGGVQDEDEERLDIDGEGGVQDDSDGLGLGFQYDDEYTMS